MLICIAQFEFKPGRREEFLKAFQKFAPVVLAEEGCIEYGALVDYKPQNPDLQKPRENVVTFIEKWKDEDAINQHMASDHFVKFQGEWKEAMVSGSLQFLTQVP